MIIFTKLTRWFTAKNHLKKSESVIEYLSRYTHKTAISNNRLLSIDDNTVTFKWRDYADDNKQKVMTLDAMEFIRRFLMHDLPLGFIKSSSLWTYANFQAVNSLWSMWRVFNGRFFIKKCIATETEKLSLSSVLNY